MADYKCAKRLNCSVAHQNLLAHENGIIMKTEIELPPKKVKNYF